MLCETLEVKDKYLGVNQALPFLASSIMRLTLTEIYGP